MRSRSKETGASTLRLPTLLAVVLALCVAGICFIVLRPLDEELHLTAVTVERGSISSSVLVNGMVVNKEEISMHSSVSAGVLELMVEDGQHVHRGQLLARLDEREANLHLLRAQANLRHLHQREEQARLDYERLAAIHELGGESGKTVEDAHLHWQSLRKEVELAGLEQSQAQLQLERYRITAPSDSVIIAAHSRVGAQLRVGDALFRLAPEGGREIEARMDAGDSAALATGNTVVIASDAYPGQSWPGTITWIAPAASREGSLNQLAFRISMKSITVPLVQGQQVDVKVEVLSQERALKLPSAAILSQDGKRYVATRSQGRIRFKEVKTGIEDASYSEILSGLREGDTIVLAQGKKLREGQAVTLLPGGGAR